ncbi:pyruvate formate lyase family protein [Rikenella microfusus]|uniref:4-hydroxyphenylacetate decarboxylase large subunit n=1 Tax=Rikenella microfusus TaxID=28139 RepID=A0A379MW45_9BACT|nr:pyruvate formate lyase family protein [Rikenella microfusus]SUE34862.1 4-hydroxyphenylacetate decarboxylase large subunit [Rikenella microfusus]
MKRILKKTVKFFLPRRIRTAYVLMGSDYTFQRRGAGRLNTIADLIRYSFGRRFFYPSVQVTGLAAARQFKSMALRLSFSRVLTAPYFYPLDPKLLRIIPAGVQGIASLTLDYAKVLTLDLNALCGKLRNNDDDFSLSVVETIDAIDVVRKRGMRYYRKRNEVLAGYLDRLMDTTPASFHEALQKILFFNALLWMNRQRHIGLGRLDMVLWPYLKRDLDAGRVTLAEARDMVKDFIVALGSHTRYKSVGLAGDTGQVILLSGTDRNGEYIENELTGMFLSVITELNIPDPKLIMRVCDRTSPELWSKAVDCLAKGNGSPLLANEPKIETLMRQFGYQAEDVIDFGTSACWEPLIIGKSFDQNNCTENLNMPDIIVGMLNDGAFDTYEDFEKTYLLKLRSEAMRIAGNARHIRFDYAPMQSIWMDGCVENLRDIGQGGAKYNYHGFLCVGLPNAVNSLLNIRKYVYEDALITYDELRKVLQDNYAGNEDLRQKLLDGNPEKFGLGSDTVLSLSDKIMRTVSEVFGQTTINGGKVKVGFSSPAYLEEGRRTGATPDGREAYMPFATHISPVSKDIDLAEIVDFAAQLHYDGNKINGNVVDFILSEQFVAQKEKFIKILQVAFRKGVYEMQLNVLNAEQLIAAKADPNLYPGLVVRVWGFSAYFNDLPEAYKDLLIERALNYAS